MTTTTPRQPVRAKARTEATLATPEGVDMREVIRETRPLKAGEYLGRNGEILAIKRDPDRDLFYVPPHLMDEGWTYEWKRQTVLGKSDDTHWVHLHENGWRVVTTEPGSRWEGHFMPAGYVGPITREGNVLMERPKAMTDAVRAMESRKANGQLRDNIDKYTRRRGAVDVPRGFAAREGEIKVGHDIGPAPDRQTTIE